MGPVYKLKLKDYYYLKWWNVQDIRKHEDATNKNSESKTHEKHFGSKREDKLKSPVFIKQLVYEMCSFWAQILSATNILILLLRTNAFDQIS